MSSPPSQPSSNAVFLEFMQTLINSMTPQKFGDASASLNALAKMLHGGYSQANTTWRLVISPIQEYDHGYLPSTNEFKEYILRKLKGSVMAKLPGSPIFEPFDTQKHTSFSNTISFQLDPYEFQQITQAFMLQYFNIQITNDKGHPCEDILYHHRQYRSHLDPKTLEDIRIIQGSSNPDLRMVCLASEYREERYASSQNLLSSPPSLPFHRAHTWGSSTQKERAPSSSSQLPSMFSSSSHPSSSSTAQMFSSPPGYHFGQPHRYASPNQSSDYHFNSSPPKKSTKDDQGFRDIDDIIADSDTKVPYAYAASETEGDSMSEDLTPTGGRRPSSQTAGARRRKAKAGSGGGRKGLHTTGAGVRKPQHPKTPKRKATTAVRSQASSALQQPESHPIQSESPPSNLSGDAIKSWYNKKIFSLHPRSLSISLRGTDAGQWYTGRNHGLVEEYRYPNRRHTSIKGRSQHWLDGRAAGQNEERTRAAEERASRARVATEKAPNQSSPRARVNNPHQTTIILSDSSDNDDV